MKVVEVRAGERRRIISALSSSMPTTYRFRAETDEGEPSGTIEVQGSNWVFPKAPVTTDLEADNVVDKGVWDTKFSITVIPDVDVRITIERRSTRSVGVFVAVIGVIVALAVISVIVTAL